MLNSNEPVKVVHFQKLANQSNMQLISAVRCIKAKKTLKQDRLRKTWQLRKNVMSNERYISNISANQTFQRTAKLLMADILQNQLHESNVM